MFTISLLLFLLMISEVMSSGCAFAAVPKKSVRKKAILLVAFGTSVPEAQKTFEGIERRTERAFPGVEVRWAFTSKTIRAKVAMEGKQLDSPETALAKLMDEEYTHVAVQSLHVIPGQEFHELNRNALLYAEMASGFERILVAPPLISSHDDMVRVAKALIKRLPPARLSNEAVLFMGHGNKKHPADAVYAAMNCLFEDLGVTNVFVATVSGYPALDDIKARLSKRQIARVYLMPFMAVAGDHVRKDMAGDRADSWKSILERDGFQCEGIITGMGEYPEIVDLWLDHLAEAFSRLE